MDHDQRFKEILKEFLTEFQELFYPVWARTFDSRRAFWLPQEIFLSPPQGEKKVLDLVARVPIRSEDQKSGPALVLLEIDSSDSIPPFRPRIFQYTQHLIGQYQLEVLPIAVFLQLVLEGQGQDVYEQRFQGQKQMEFTDDYVALPGLAGERYLRGSNLLGVALSAVMRWPKEKRVEAALEALERIVTSQESNWRKYLLAECIQAYAPLDQTQRIELSSLLQQPQRKDVFMRFKTWTEEASEQGQSKERLRLLRKLLEIKFQQPLSETARQRLETWPPNRLEQLEGELLQPRSLKELGLED